MRARRGIHRRIATVGLLLAGAGSAALAQRQFEVPTRAPGEAPASVVMIEDGEPGTPLVVRGRVEGPDGPVAGVSVFAYQTDAEGIYSEVGNRRPRIRGYARTDGDGRFELHTVRPASYPDSRVQQHIHYHLYAEGRDRETVGEIVFDDDPLLSDRRRRSEVVCDPRPADDANGETCEVVLKLG